jgi:hypothetical protein
MDIDEAMDYLSQVGHVSSLWGEAWYTVQTEITQLRTENTYLVDNQVELWVEAFWKGIVSAGSQSPQTYSRDEIEIEARQRWEERGNE